MGLWSYDVETRGKWKLPVSKFVSEMAQNASLSYGTEFKHQTQYKQFPDTISKFPGI